MKVLIGCEYSAVIREAFYRRGHYVWSCDYKPTEKPGQYGYHYQGDIFDMLSDHWDLLIAHPPCTYLSNVGQSCKSRDNVWEFREAEALKAIDFVDRLWKSGIDKICLENPVGQLNTQWRKPTQIIQPYYFGDNEMKTTCLWLRRLPKLNGLHYIDKVRDKPKPLPGKSRIGSDGKIKNVYFCGRMDRSADSKMAAHLKARTFPGIARAMAEQWG